MEEGHVLPLLCSIGRNGIEFLLMDVVGPESDLTNSLRIMLRQFTAPENILFASGVRQADNGSCRTGALSLLRNSMLSLEFHHYKEGLRDPLQWLLNQPINPDNVALPSDWTYIEQIFHGQENRLAIRDCFSKKSEKRYAPRSVALFRQQHTELVRFRCTLFNKKDYRTDFENLIPPEGVRAEINQ